MMQRKRTKKNKPVLIALQTRVEPELVGLLDGECREKGLCSRAVVIRQMLMERYLKRTKEG